MSQIYEIQTPATKLFFREGLQILASINSRTWLKALGIALAAALVIGIPTRLIPNPIFVRMVPTTPIDYVIYVISSLLIGLTWALPRDGDRYLVSGGIGTFLAVGCPTCNKLVLLLLGSGGALTYFAPLQPIIGLISVGLLALAFWRRLGHVKSAACPLR